MALAVPGRCLLLLVRTHSAHHASHGLRARSRAGVDTREFTKPRRGRRGQRRLKNQFMFYLRVSRYS